MFKVKYYIDPKNDIRKTEEYTVFGIDRHEDGSTLFLVFDCYWFWIDSEQCEPIESEPTE